MANSLKKDQNKVTSINIYWYVINDKKMLGGTCHAIHHYAKANNKYMKYYDRNKESSYLKYWDVNKLHEWAVSRKLPVDGYKWVENTSQYFFLSGLSFKNIHDSHLSL